MDNIGKYEVLATIGTGGFGTVYEGRDPFLKRRVAIKTCTSDELETRQRFFREAEIAGNLHHRNITTVHDFGIQGEIPYLVQEYLSGEDLHRVIQRRQELTAGRKVDILLQIARGLAHAHAQGVIHRDIKPANIRVLEDGVVKIMDFGIAKLAHAESQLTQTGMTLGTAAYLAPEQIRGTAIDQRADIFSYGVLSYELLAYRRPFEGRTISTLFVDLLHRDPTPLSQHWPGCPAELEAIVNRSLEKAPEQRYPDLQPVIAGLAAVLRALREQARQAEPVEQPGGAESTRRISRNDLLAAWVGPEDEPTTREKTASLPGFVAEIAAALADGDPDRAALHLDQAESRFGGTPMATDQLAPLRRRLEEERQRRLAATRTAQLAALANRARVHLEEGEIESAESCLQEARARDPESELVQDLEVEVGDALAALRAEQRRRDLLSETESKVTAAISEGALGHAAGLLAAASDEIGPTTELLLLEGAVAEARRRELLDRAAALRDQGLGDQAASVLRGFLEEAPEDREAQALLAETEVATQPQLSVAEGGAGRGVPDPQAAERSSRVQELLLEADQLAARGRLEEACTRAEAAANLDPGNPEPRSLLDRLRGAQVVRRAEQRRQLDEEPLAGGTEEVAAAVETGIERLRADLEEVRQVAAAPEIDRAVSLAMAELDAGRLEGAIESLRHVEQLAPLDGTLARRLHETEDALVRQREERQERSQAETYRRIETLIQRQRRDESVVELERAEGSFGREIFAPLRAELRALEAQLLDAELARDVARAERLVAGGHLPEAVAIAGKVLEADPHHAGAQQVLQLAKEAISGDLESAEEARADGLGPAGGQAAPHLPRPRPTPPALGERTAAVEARAGSRSQVVGAIVAVGLLLALIAVLAFLWLG